MSESLVAIRPVPSPPRDGAPPRFAAWPEGTKERCFEIWSAIGNRSAPRTERLISDELGPDVVAPAHQTIREWAREEGWRGRANVELERSHHRTVYELRASFIAGIQASVETLHAAVLGELDHLGNAGLVRVRAAEAMLKAAAQSGVLERAPVAPETIEGQSQATLSAAQRDARMRDLWSTESQHRHG